MRVALEIVACLASFGAAWLYALAMDDWMKRRKGGWREAGRGLMALIGFGIIVVMVIAYTAVRTTLLWLG